MRFVPVPLLLLLIAACGGPGPNSPAASRAPAAANHVKALPANVADLPGYDATRSAVRSRLDEVSRTRWGLGLADGKMADWEASFQRDWAELPEYYRAQLADYKPAPIGDREIYQRFADWLASAPEAERKETVSIFADGVERRYRDALDPPANAFFVPWSAFVRAEQARAKKENAGK
jgi:hypothetical protein